MCSHFWCHSCTLSRPGSRLDLNSTLAGRKQVCYDNSGQLVPGPRGLRSSVQRLSNPRGFLLMRPPVSQLAAIFKVRGGRLVLSRLPHHAGLVSQAVCRVCAAVHVGFACAPAVGLASPLSVVLVAVAASVAALDGLILPCPHNYVNPFFWIFCINIYAEYSAYLA